MHISLKNLLLLAVVGLGMMHAQTPEAAGYERLYAQSHRVDCIDDPTERLVQRRLIESGFEELSTQQEDQFTRGRAWMWRAAHADEEGRKRHLEDIAACDKLPMEFRRAAEGNIIGQRIALSDDRESEAAANDLAVLLEKLQEDNLRPELSPESHMWTMLAELLERYPTFETGIAMTHPSLFERPPTPVF